LSRIKMLKELKDNRIAMDVIIIIIWHLIMLDKSKQLKVSSSAI